MKIKYFEDYAEFRQTIKVSSNTITSVIGEVKFISDTRCLPPTYVDLNFDLSNALIVEAKEND